MLLFISEEHVDSWCRDWRIPRGGVLTVEQGWRLAEKWFGRHRGDPDWRRPTVEEAQGLLSSVGLEGEFWSLR